MSLVLKHNFLPKAKQINTIDPYLIVLHDTAGPTLHSAEETLKERVLGYHYMIDRDGTCFEYAVPQVRMNHALNVNNGTVGISMVGGGEFGPVNDLQIQACIKLIKERVLKLAPSIKSITGHKHVNPGRKFDPRFEGEPPLGIVLIIDQENMTSIAQETGLVFRSFR